jgi:hypothetical protein
MRSNQLLYSLVLILALSTAATSGYAGPDGGIKPIDPDLDMTKLGRIERNPLQDRGPNVTKETADKLERDIEQFDQRLGLKAPPVSSPALRPGYNRHLGTKQKDATNAPIAIERQAILQEELNQTPTIGEITPPSSAVMQPTMPMNETPPAVTVSPPEEETFAGVTPDPALRSGLSGTGFQLSATDVTTLRGLFFPDGSSIALVTQSATNLELRTGAKLPSDLPLTPLPDVLLNSADATNLGYVYDGQSIVIADFDTRTVIGVVDKGT